MGRACSICHHKEFTQINEALLDGMSGVVVSQSFGVSPDSVKRHRREHLLTGKCVVGSPSGTAVGTRIFSSAHRTVGSVLASAVRELVNEDVSGTPGGVAVRLVGQRETAGHILDRLMEAAKAAEDRKDFVTAIIAYDKAASLVLKAAKIWPDAPSKESLLADGADEENTLLLIRAAMALPLAPAEWELH